MKTQMSYDRQMKSDITVMCDRRENRNKCNVDCV